MSHDLGVADDWDPLAEEYHSPNFNSYVTGPGVHLPLECLPAFSDESQIPRSRSLFIKNIPEGLTEGGLKSLFSRCGAVLNCQKLKPKPENPTKTIGFIDYRTTREALAAIAALHNKPPFFLKVNLSAMSLSERWKFDAKKKEELEEIRRKIEERHGLPAYNVPSQPGAGRGRGLLASYAAEDLKSIQVEVGSKPGERRIYSSPDSSRSVSSPPPPSHESSSSANYQGDERLRVVITGDSSGELTRKVIYSDPPRPGPKCLVCGSYSEFVCNVCKGFYCSSTCQLKDWPTHKSVCRAKPSLLPTPQVKPTGGDNAVVSPPRPSAQKSNAPSPKGPKDKACDRTGPQAGPPKKPQEPARSPNKPNKAAPPPRTPPVQPELQRPAAKVPSGSANLEPATLPQEGSTEVTLCYGNDLSEFFLQRSSNMAELAQLQADLQASCASNRGHQPAVGEFCAALFADDNQWYRAKVTSAGPKCEVYFVDYGNTAPVAAENTCRIPDGCMRLPAQAVRCRLHGVRPLATVGAWPEEAFAELASVMQEGPLVAKVLRRAEDFHEVELAPMAGGESLNQRLVAKGLGESTATVAAPAAAPHTAEPTSCSSSSVVPGGPPGRMQSVLSMAQVGQTLPLQVTVSAHEQVWCLVVLPEVAVALVKVEEALQEEGAKADGGSPPHGVSSGSYVASRSSEDGRWYRAYVTRMAGQEVSVRYVDYGNDESKTKVIALSPAHVSAVPAAAVRLLTSDPRSYFAGQLLSFAVQSVEGTTVRGTVTSDDDGRGLGTLALAAWDYELPSEEPAAAAATPSLAKPAAAPPAASPPQKRPPPCLTMNMEAKVLHVPLRKLPATKCPMVPVWKTPEVLFLQQKSLSQELEAMMGALNTWVKEEQPKPTVASYSKGDYVCALFSEDATWYRGQVVGIRSSAGRYLVMFIDFGNSEELPSSCLRPLPPRFAEPALFAFCVVPQGVCAADPRLVALLEQEPFSAVQVDASKGGLPVVRLERRDGTCLNDLATQQSSQQPPAATAKLPQVPQAVAGSSTGKPSSSPQGTPKKPPSPAVEPPPPPAQQPPVTVQECPVGGPGQLDCVVSAVEGNLVFVQPLSRCDALVSITKALANEAAQASTGALSGLPPVGQFVLALYSEDNSWYRAKVVSVDKATSTVRVSFVDFGNTESVSAKDLLPMRPELAREAACAFPVQLEGVPLLVPRAGDVLPKQLLTVVLLDSGKPPLARLLVGGKCINDVAAAPKEASAAAPKEAFVERPLPSGRSKTTISHIDPEGCCYVQQLSLAPALQSLMVELNGAVPAEPVASPAAGDAVCALYAADKLWYRARVLSSPEGGQCRVAFVDFGNDDLVPLADIRALPDNMKAVHLFANRVALQGVKSVSKEYAAQLLNVAVELEVADDTSQPCRVKLYVDDQCLNDLIE